jgi:hypothetical protein
VNLLFIGSLGLLGNCFGKFGLHQFFPGIRWAVPLG